MRQVTYALPLSRGRRVQYCESLARALELGRDHLQRGTSSLDTVEAVIRLLEDDPQFNAGRG